MNGQRFNPGLVGADGSTPAPVEIPAAKLLWQIQVADHPFIGQQRTQLLIQGVVTIEEAVAKAKESEGYAMFKQHFPTCGITGAGFLGAVEL